MALREGRRPSKASVIRQGFLVGVLNPKALVFFVAVFPHFVNRSSGNVTAQLVIFGGLFSVMAFFSDGTWGFIAGTAREWLSGVPSRLVTLRTIGALVMMALGVIVMASVVAS